MKVTLLLLAPSAFVTMRVSTQPPDTAWTRTYGDRDSDYDYEVTSTSDGYVIAGSCGDWVYLLKTDRSGTPVWSHTFPRAHPETANQRVTSKVLLLR